MARIFGLSDDTVSTIIRRKDDLDRIAQQYCFLVKKMLDCINMEYSLSEELSEECEKRLQQLSDYIYDFIEKESCDHIHIKYADNQCGNCHAELRPSDKYCRECGTKRGKGEYKPYMDLMECIYGPMPVERKHICHNCGNQWINIVMVDREKYCPVCGSKVEIEDDEISNGNAMFSIFKN